MALFAEALAPRESAPVAAGAPTPVVPPRRPASRLALVGMVVVAVIGGAFVLLRAGRRPEPPAPAAPAFERTAIAVLPFQNLSAEGPHAYFAGGLHDELLTQLTKLPALKVIGRTSVLTYAGSAKRLSEIADELAVGSIVEGSVQVVGDRLRATVQLIDAATDAHLRVERYDRTLDDAFAIQSDVAQRVSAAVGAALASGDRQAITEMPTANPEAYRFYLQGRSYHARPGYRRENYEAAEQLYERALGLDPGFALARAALSEVHGWMYWQGYDPVARRRERQREEAEAALRRAPDLPKVHVAMGLAHYMGRDYRQALEEFGVALKGLPNDAELWTWIGFAQRRLGNWGEALAALQMSSELEPRDANIHYLLGQTLAILRRYPEALDALRRALALAPDLVESRVEIGWIHAAWRGELDTLRAALETVPPTSNISMRGTLLLWQRRPDSLLMSLKRTVFGGEAWLEPLYAGWAHWLRGDTPRARAAFDSARVLLDSVVRARPDAWPVHSARGLVLAGLGRRQEALQEARWLQQSPVYEDGRNFGDLSWGRARILALSGEADAAVDEIERLLGRPSKFSVHLVRLDPRYDPIRDHPRFKALLAKYAPQ